MARYTVPTEALAIYRIAFVLFVLLVKGLPSYVWLGSIPDVLYRPPTLSLAAIFDGFPTVWLLHGLTIATALLYVAVLFGYRTRLSSLLLGAALLMGNSFTYAFGKINHNDLFIMLVPLLMAFSTWGNAYSIDRRSGRTLTGSSSWPIATLALLLGFAMFTAGVPKLLVGWLDPSTQAVQGYLLHRFHAIGISDYLAPALAESGLAGGWEILDYVTVLFELSFLPAVLRPRVFRAFLGLAVGFHLANLLVLNIAFASNLIVYLLFINWAPALDWFHRSRASRALPRFASVRLLTAMSALVVGAVIARTVIEPDISEDALRAVANQTEPGVVSPLNVIESMIGVRLDLNLVLMSLAGLAVLSRFARVLWRSQPPNRDQLTAPGMEVTSRLDAPSDGGGQAP